VMNKKREKIFLWLILAAALAVRLLFLFRGLEYDEIWSLENFSRLSTGKIFSDLATPNNHPVNTLLIKFLDYGREKFWTIRLGSLFFSLGSVYLLFLLGKAFHRKYGWYAALAGAFLPPVIIAGTTARGYAGQLFFLLLTALALIKCRKGSYQWTITAAAAGVLAVISLPSSALYLIPAGILFILQLWKKRRLYPAHLTIFPPALLAAAAWYAVNWKNFAASSQFKVPVNSAGELLLWLSNATALNAIPLWLIIPLLLFYRKRHSAWALFFIIIFPLAAALFTSPAPARVYLPGVAAGTLLITPKLKNIRYNCAVAVLLLGIQFAVSLPVLPDTVSMDEMTAFNEINGIVTVYGANESYPVSWNHPESIELFFRQLHKASGMEYCALLLAEYKISGVDSSGKTVIKALPPELENISGSESTVILKLQKTNRIQPDTTAFAFYPPTDEKIHINNVKYLDAKELIYLNCWLTVPLNTPDGSCHRYALIAFTTDRERIFPPGMPVFTFVRK